MKNICFVIILIAAVAILSSISGCTSTMQVRDETLTQGCKVSRLGAATGMVNTNGKINMCGLKCTDSLPKGYYIEVSDQQSGCKAGIKK